MKIKEIMEARVFFISGISKIADRSVGKAKITEKNGCPSKSKGMEDEEHSVTVSPKTLAKMQDKLAKRDVDASIDAIRDFMDDANTPRAKRLISQLKKLGYDTEEGLDGNEGFFKDLGVARPAREKVELDENEETTVRCPICKKVVEKDDLEDHVEEHESKRPVKKMKKMEESKEPLEVEYSKDFGEWVAEYGGDVIKLGSHSNKASALKKAKRLLHIKEGEGEEENLGDEGLLPKKIGKKLKKKKDTSDEKFKKEYPPLKESKDVFTDLDSRQKNELVKYMGELIKTKTTSSPSEAAHLSLEDVAGFESALDEEKNKVARELVSLYKKSLTK